jgi:single-strand DNA-binding protein
MRDVNQVTLVGRLVKNPDLRYTNGGLAILNLSLAVNRSVKRGDKYEDEVSFFDASLVGKQAEAVAKYLDKGKQIAITGSLVQDRWEKDGQKRSRVKIQADSLQMFGKSEHKPSDNMKPEQNVRDTFGPEEFESDIPF